MLSDKLKRYVKYRDSLKEKLTAPLPEKHKDRPEEYKKFIMHELEIAENRIEILKLEGVIK